MARWSPQGGSMEKKSRYKYKEVPGTVVKGPTAYPGREGSDLHPTTGSGDGTTKIDPSSARAEARYGKMLKGSGQ